MSKFQPVDANADFCRFWPGIDEGFKLYFITFVNNTRGSVPLVKYALCTSAEALSTGVFMTGWWASTKGDAFAQGFALFFDKAQNRFVYFEQRKLVKWDVVYPL